MGVLIIDMETGEVIEDGSKGPNGGRYQPNQSEMGIPDAQERRPTIYDMPQPSLQIVPVTPTRERPINPFYNPFRGPEIDKRRTPHIKNPVLH